MAKNIHLTEESDPEMMQKLNLVAQKESVPVSPRRLARFGLNEWLDERMKELGLKLPETNTQSAKAG